MTLYCPKSGCGKKFTDSSSSKQWTAERKLKRHIKQSKDHDETLIQQIGSEASRTPANQRGAQDGSDSPPASSDGDGHGPSSSPSDGRSRQRSLGMGGRVDPGQAVRLEQRAGPQQQMGEGPTIQARPVVDAWTGIFDYRLEQIKKEADSADGPPSWPDEFSEEEKQMMTDALQEGLAHFDLEEFERVLAIGQMVLVPVSLTAPRVLQLYQRVKWEREQQEQRDADQDADEDAGGETRVRAPVEAAEPSGVQGEEGIDWGARG